MQRRIRPWQLSDGEPSASDKEERRPYIAPRLEQLGSWSALTLEQSVGIAFLRAIFDDPTLWGLDDFR